MSISVTFKILLFVAFAMNFSLTNHKSLGQKNTTSCLQIERVGVYDKLKA